MCFQATCLDFKLCYEINQDDVQKSLLTDYL